MGGRRGEGKGVDVVEQVGVEGFENDVHDGREVATGRLWLRRLVSKIGLAMARKGFFWFLSERVAEFALRTAAGMMGWRLSRRRYYCRRRSETG